MEDNRFVAHAITLDNMCFRFFRLVCKISRLRPRTSRQRVAISAVATSTVPMPSR